MSQAEVFLRNLTECSLLERVNLLMRAANMPRALQMELAKLNATVEISLVLDGDLIFENASEFKFINLLGDKVKYIYLDGRTHWDQRFTPALRHLVDKCLNLTSVSLTLVPQQVQNLAPLFMDEERARKFTGLCLVGDFDEDLLKLNFENCVNLDTLVVNCCPRLGDHHLINLADRGARLSKLSFSCCENITDEGVIPLLMNSSDKLSYFHFPHHS